MRLFDSHNHLQDERLFPNRTEVMQRAWKAGVMAMGVKGRCESDWQRVVKLAAEYKGIHPSFGLHPWFVSKRSPNWLRNLEKQLLEHSRAGVGEIGIDPSAADCDEQDQEQVFLQQLQIAQRLKRVVSVHCRRAWGRLIKLLDQFGILPSGMLIHCFGGSAQIAEALIQRGCYISFSGSITRPDAKHAGAVLRAVPIERLLLETDAPDILPASAKGPLNEPAMLRYVLEKSAQLRGVPEKTLAKWTFQNAARFFSADIPMEHND